MDDFIFGYWVQDRLYMVLLFKKKGGTVSKTVFVRGKKDAQALCREVRVIWPHSQIVPTKMG